MRVATDVGGTFTDLVMYSVDERTGAAGELQVAKVDTTPPHFEEGVFDSLRKAGADPKELSFFAHGSTVVINAITERKGVRTALVTTHGFRDILEIGRCNRPDLFNFRFRKPKPFVDRYLRAELRERTAFDGAILQPVDLSPLPDLIGFFRAEGVEAIAVCLLHAYANPENERRVVAAIRELWGEVSVVASHEISREWREYERTTTTVLSAYVHPVAERYIDALEQRLEAAGCREAPFMMQSNGGMATAGDAKANPISMIESGPASGIFAAAFMGQTIGCRNVMVLDIGGTTAKCALIEDGAFKVVTEYHVERDRRNPGYPVQTPVSDIVEIGNGGGSIAWVDAGGKLHVGPQSAGARPGPAAYGRGGTRPTTTDANLVLGRIDPAQFVGGEVEPDWRAIDAAFLPLCQALGCTKTELARGIVRIANANMTNALRLVSTNRGHDPRDFVLMAFGGGGAMHAVALAEELQIPKVVIPVNSAVFSAWGMLLTDLRRDYVRTRAMRFAAETVDDVERTFDAIERDAAEAVGAQALLTRFERFADLRYAGQEHTVKTPVERLGAGGICVQGTVERFATLHDRLYTFRLDRPVEIVNYHLVARTPVPKPALPARPVTDRTVGEARIGSREVDFDRHGIHLAAIYDGCRMEPGMALSGPAVIQEPSATIIISPGHRASMDGWGNYHIDLAF